MKLSWEKFIKKKKRIRAKNKEQFDSIRTRLKYKIINFPSSMNNIRVGRNYERVPRNAFRGIYDGSQDYWNDTEHRGSVIMI